MMMVLKLVAGECKNGGEKNVVDKARRVVINLVVVGGEK